MKVAFKTLGCKVNQYETQLLREQCRKAGFAAATGPADIYIINTCTVTRKSDSESRRLIRLARRENPAARIIVTGCYAELDRGAIERIGGAITVIKGSEKDTIVRHLNPRCDPSTRAPAMTGGSLGISPHDVPEGTPGLSRGLHASPGGITAFEGRTKAFVKVQDGCDNFCSYCKVPLVRGRSRSRGPEEIVEEICALAANGYKEIILTGICLGDWGRARGLSLADLVRRVDAMPGQFRIRLSSVEPWYVRRELLECLAASNRTCRHLHIPMQSGDDDVLARMNRNFRAGDFRALIERARGLMPELAFTTDVMVGFPGETDAQFDNTVRLLEMTMPSRIHIFPYSARRGTKAFLYQGHLPAPLIKVRAGRLRSLAQRLADGYKNKFLGRSLQVLVETRRDRHTGLLTGYTDNYLKVAFQGPDTLKGKCTPLTLTTDNSYGILATRLEGV